MHLRYRNASKAAKKAEWPMYACTGNEKRDSSCEQL